MILIILGCGVNASGSLTGALGQGTGWLMGAVGWGLAVAMAIFAVGEISGAHINPAVTLGLAAAGEFAWVKVPGYLAAQFAGAFIGAVIVYCHYLPHWSKTDNPDVKLGVFATAPAFAHTPANFLSEVIGTFLLLFGLLALGANTFTEGLKPLVVGLLITAIGISLGSTTGYAINPARDLGPRLAHALLPIPGKGSSRWPYAWVPVLAPIVGGLYGAVFYNAIFLARYNGAFWAGSVVVLAVFGWALVSGHKAREEGRGL